LEPNFLPDPPGEEDDLEDEYYLDCLQVPLMSIQLAYILPSFRTSIRDASSDTYIIGEGSILRITQQNHTDQYLYIPLQERPETANEAALKSRIPKDATILALQPW
jgi:hypothetical protein